MILPLNSSFNIQGARNTTRLEGISCLLHENSLIDYETGERRRFSDPGEWLLEQQVWNECDITRILVLKHNGEYIAKIMK